MMQSDAETVIKELLDASGLPYSGVSRIEAAGQEIFSIESGESSKLIGMRGDTVHAIDLLVKKIYEKRNPPAEGVESAERTPMFLVDVNDYRTRQIKDLQAKALMMAERARSFQYDVELSPMSSYERLIVHTALANEPNIKTESQGEGRNRRVIIKYAQ
jgi:spoIIIJ-associated protein